MPVSLGWEKGQPESSPLPTVVGGYCESLIHTIFVPIWVYYVAAMCTPKRCHDGFTR